MSGLFPENCRYIPPENALFVATGPLDSLWHAVDAHFGSVIQPLTEGHPKEAHKGSVRTAVENLQENLAKNNLPVAHLSNFAAYGIDAARGIFASLYRADNETMGPFVFVIPILNQSTFKDTLRRLYPKDTMEVTQIPGISKTANSFKIAEIYMSFPETGIALLSDNPELLARSLRDRSANLEYARRNDDLYDGVRQCLGSPIGTGPTAFVFARPNLPGVLHISIGLNLRKDDVLLKAQLGVRSNVVKLINDLLAHPPTDAAWSKRLPSEVASVVLLQDKTLGQIIGTLGSWCPIIKDVLQKMYGGFLWSLRDSPMLSRVVIAVSGYRDGLPEVLTGIWGDQTQIESELRKLQIQFRRDRDVEILTAVNLTMVAGSSLDRVSILSPEPFSTFGRYTQGPEGEFSGQPTAQDLANETYTKQVAGQVIHYVAPRLTANDRRFRKQFEKLSDAELEDSEGLDRYRIAYVSHEGAVWLATNINDLKTLLAARSDSLSNSPYFTSSTHRQNARDKMQIFLNIDQLTKFGLLSPQSSIEDFVKDYLMDLRDHPAVAIDLQPCGARRECLSISVRFLSRAAIR